MYRKILLAGSLACCTQVATASAGQGLFDPTRPWNLPAATATAEDPAKATPQPRLQALFTLGSEYSALIDGARVRTGDLINDFKIMAIDVHGVELLGPDGTIRLRMGLPSMKKLAQETKP